MAETVAWATMLTLLMAAFELIMLISSQYYYQGGMNKESKLERVVTLVRGVQVHIFTSSPTSPIASK